MAITKQHSQNCPFDADLHNHTTFSDGEYTPKELVECAHSLGLKAVAITDHDTLDGLPEALKAGSQLGVKVICGVEITMRFTEPIFTGSLHLLVFFPESLLANSAFTRETRSVLAEGRGASLTRARIKAINAHFGPKSRNPALAVELEESHIYAHGDHISRRHFAMALSDLGIADKSEITRIIGNKSPAYIPSGVPMNTLKGFLNRWPLARVLAHPAAGSFPGDSHYKEVLPPFEIMEQLLPRFLELGLDGFEVYYPGHTPEWEQHLINLAQELNLPLTTGGSDCHDKIERRLGVKGCDYAVVEKMEEIWRQ